MLCTINGINLQAKQQFYNEKKSYTIQSLNFVWTRLGTEKCVNMVFYSYFLLCTGQNP